MSLATPPNVQLLQQPNPIERAQRAYHNSVVGSKPCWAAAGDALLGSQLHEPLRGEGRVIAIVKKEASLHCITVDERPSATGTRVGVVEPLPRELHCRPTITLANPIVDRPAYRPKLERAEAIDFERQVRRHLQVEVRTIPELHFQNAPRTLQALRQKTCQDSFWSGGPIAFKPSEEESPKRLRARSHRDAAEHSGPRSSVAHRR